IELRPLRTLTGVSEFNEMFLDEVRIPVENLVGAENDGWRVAMVTFSFERGTAFVSELLGSMVMARDLANVAKAVGAWDDQSIRRDLAIVVAELESLWAYTKRNISTAAKTGTTGVGGSIFKLGYHDARLHLADVTTRVLARRGLALDDLGQLSRFDHVERSLYALSLSIAAGTSQIQRNIVGERLLGLPKERAWT
ncbi:MAG: acyl-CoA dehydrogenase protein, partial [Ilumatobacteraceae bacterium]|nr:acyl-CoA dehydrogenase protein [Ilumatobacteraceae bacterium]